jgi:DNA repair protein RecO (recombination protein O)
MDAFVLKTLDYKDAHKLVYFYTLEGLKSAIAYQTKKMTSRTRYILQPLTRVDVTFSTGKIPSVKEVELLDDYQNIKDDLISYTYASHILELIYGTVNEDDDHQKMFSFLSRLLLLMKNQDASTITMIFELKLLHFIGYGLQFKQCQICGNTEDLVFHPSSGGVTCSSHIEGLDMIASKEETAILKQLYYLNIDTDKLPSIEPHTKQKLRFIIDILYDEFVGYKTKSSKIIKQLEKNDEAR